MNNSIEITDYKKTKSLNDLQEIKLRKVESKSSNKTILCIIALLLVLILLYVVLIKTGLLKSFL